MNRDFLEMIINITIPIMILIGVFIAAASSFCWIVSHKQSQYLKNHYNINISATDIFWNEELVMSELRSKGIITDSNQSNNIKIIKE